MEQHHNQNVNKTKILRLYDKPLPSKRNGPLFNAFSYPTKISPETIAVFIATHTKPGDVVLDPFAGSGTTGLAALLCDRPTKEMIEFAEKLGLEPEWGPRTAHLYEIGILGSFISRTLCNPPDPIAFSKAASKLIKQAERSIGWFYRIKDPDGMDGMIRHVIWSDVIICPHCGSDFTFWEAAVRYNPLEIVEEFQCSKCGSECKVNDCERVLEEVEDDFHNGPILRKKRVMVQVYGQTGQLKWKRNPTDEDLLLFHKVQETELPAKAPNKEIVWGDLYRSGYHKGISKLHHFYTRRNFRAVAVLWELVDQFPEDVQDALRLLILSYNSTHSTLMTRVVVKQNQPDFVLSGSQSGVLYISGLPVEKNVLLGLKRKAYVIEKAISILKESRSKVTVYTSSSEKLDLPDGCVDYIFTDPPFGGYIPYSEINQINELWLGYTTDRSKEIIVSKAEGKSVEDYGNMMFNVFSEMARVLKPAGLATVVFHSAYSSVWKALSQAYESAGFGVEATSILDKIQSSFKQIVSKISVKGDPLLLLTKVRGLQIDFKIKPEQIIEEILQDALGEKKEELDPQRLWSQFVGRCLEVNIDVPMEAREFYKRINRVLEEVK